MIGPYAALLLACAGRPGVDSAMDVDGATGGLSQALSLEAGARVGYTLSLDWEGATFTAGEAVFQTDLGHRIGLSQARVASIGAQLAPCQTDTGLAWSPLDLLSPPAYADHVTVADSSLLSAVVVEDLLAAERTSYGVGTASGLDYCEVHWLSGATTEDGMEGQSVRLVGWMEGPDTGETRTFEAEIWLSAGGLPALTASQTPTAPLALNGEALDAEVEILRYPARALDGEALDALSDAEIAYAFLAGLGRGAAARVWR